MEEDIKVLENMIRNFKTIDKNTYKIEDLYVQCKYKHYKAIENLINRVKDLELINQSHQEENGKLRKRIKELEKELDRFLN